MKTISQFLPLKNSQAAKQSDIPTVSAQEFCESVTQAVKTGNRLCALFADPNKKEAGLCAVLADDQAGMLYALNSTPLDRYPSMTLSIPQAHLFEREIYESTGIMPEGHPWLKSVRKSLPDTVSFFSEEGHEIHEVAVGPVHAGIIEPGHFRFQCHGETVHHLEIQLGYQHRGIEKMLLESPDKRSIFLAESIAGDTVIGHSLAYCMALESLTDAKIPPRGEALRALALELERLANHIGDLGAMSGDVGYLPAAAYFGRLRGEFLNLLMELSGNRYGRGLVRPGGVAFDCSAELAKNFSGRIKKAHSDFEEIATLLFEASSVLSRFEETGVLSKTIALDLGLVGISARASGINLDVRKNHPHGIYRARPIESETAESGDVYARAFVRFLESRRSLNFIEALIADFPDGPIFSNPARPKPDHFAISLVEGWRGEICHVAKTDAKGRLSQYKIVDPSFHNWMGVAMALRNGEISDFPLCNKSFNLSYAGHDL